MAGTDITRIAKRATIGQIALVNNGYLISLLLQIKCTTEANDASAYDENLFCH
jgi:hypothetical protein